MTSKDTTIIPQTSSPAIRNNVLGLRARAAKLRAMSFRELAGRVVYRLRVDAERRRHRRGQLAPADRLMRALRSDLRGHDWQDRLLAARRSPSARRFFPSVYAPARMRQLFESRFQTERCETIRHAAEARAGRFEFFGLQFTYGDDIDWHRDPVTGRRWPVCFHADVPIHGGDVGFGDVKHVWELSRQQYLVDLAKSYVLTGNVADYEAMRRLVRGWNTANPYGTGINWSCALEPSFRAWSWLWAYHLTCDALDGEFHLEWLTAFFDHGRFLNAHLEHYSSPYNHLVGEAATLFALGCCFPEFRDAARWRRLGRQVLERRLPEQFYEDGGSVEQSTFYHHATCGFYLLAGLLARANGEELSSRVWSAIERALEFSVLLAQPDGRTPEIGGADDGKPIRLEHVPFWDFRPYYAVGAVLFGRDDFAAAAGRFHEDALWLLGDDGLRRFEELPRAPRLASSAMLAHSGYFVARRGPRERADYVCVDVGEQAAGMRTDAVPNSMHGHADCLSVIAWLGGRRVLVDSGLYAYNCGGAWEAHFRETAAHNTARIDGRDQARHIGKMAWSHSYRAFAEAFDLSSDAPWVIGSHDGYARGRDGIVHRRAVWLCSGSSLVVCDEFVGTGEHELEINYQFAPGMLECLGRQHALFDNHAHVVWAGDGRWTSEIRCGGAAPSDGWICSSLGVRHAAPRLTLRSRSAMPRTTLVALITAADVDVQAVGESEAGDPTLIAACCDEHTDWVAAGRVRSQSPFDTDGLIARCRIGPDGSAALSQIGGTYVDVDRERLLRYAGGRRERGRR